MNTKYIYINCGFCGEKLKPFERDKANKTNEPLCLNCWIWFKEKMKNAKMEINESEQYMEVEE
jgi:hypothetical protein